MLPLRLAAVVLAFAVAHGASAQPLVLPGARLSGPEGSPAPEGPASEAAPGAPASRAPAPLRPVGVRPVSEASVIGRDLALNGSAGMLRLQQTGGAGTLGVRLTVPGTMLSKPGESCAVSLGQDTPVPAVPEGRPDGVPRYRVEAPACPITFDILDGAVWVKGPDAACAFEAADCRVDPRGLWGPAPAVLIPQARAIEQERGAADKAVRENYKVMTQRARPADIRTIVSEQAGFSAERETLCRAYAREGAHGFCHARFTEARAAALAARLGLAPAAERRAAPPHKTKPRPAPLPAAPVTGAPGEIR